MIWPNDSYLKLRVRSYEVVNNKIYKRIEYLLLIKVGWNKSFSDKVIWFDVNLLNGHTEK